MKLWLTSRNCFRLGSLEGALDYLFVPKVSLAVLFVARI